MLPGSSATTNRFGMTGSAAPVSSQPRPIVGTGRRLGHGPARRPYKAAVVCRSASVDHTAPPHTQHEGKSGGVAGIYNGREAAVLGENVKETKKYRKKSQAEQRRIYIKINLNNIFDTCFAL